MLDDLDCRLGGSVPQNLERYQSWGTPATIGYDRH